MKSPLIFRIFKNNQLKEVKQFDQDQIVIGQNADVHLDLDGEGISPIHCLIELRDSGYYLCDLGSQSGTFKNGQAVLDELISSGDEVVIGSYKLQFFVGVPKPKSNPPGTAIVNSEVKQAEPEIATVKLPEVQAEKTAATKTEVVVPTNVGKATVPDKIPEMSVAPIMSGLEVVPDANTQTAPVKKPEIKIAKSVSKSTRRKKRGGTFAPPSEVKDLTSYIKPGKGPYVEVLVCWRERILNSYVFKTKQVVRLVEGADNPLSLPAEYAPRAWPLLDTTSGVKVNLTSEMSCEVLTSTGIIKGDALGARIQKNGSDTSIRLEVGEAIFLTQKNSDLVLIFRYSAPTGIIAMESPMMLSASELTALVLAILMAGLFKFYIDSNTPADWGHENEEEVQRVAQVIFNPPKQNVPTPPPQEPKEEVVLPPPPPPKPPDVQKAEVADKMQNTVKKGAQDKLEQSKKPQVAARASEVAPKPNSKDLPKKFTSTRQGGAVKTTTKAGANAQSANKDISKVGLFSTFGAGGNRAKLDQAYSGSGELLGMADKATGTSGFAENRAGGDLGSKFKDTGAGGKGTATQGIAGVGTKGRGSGMNAYGASDGFGSKTSVSVVSGGAEEDFVGTIDREAIRRVIRAKLHEVKSCYERALNNRGKGNQLEGKVVIGWEIVAKGQARNAKVKSSTLNSTEVENCIRDRLASWVFPEPPEGMTAEVAYPFVLNQAN